MIAAGRTWRVPQVRGLHWKLAASYARLAVAVLLVFLGVMQLVNSAFRVGWLRYSFLGFALVVIVLGASWMGFGEGHRIRRRIWSFRETGEELLSGHFPTFARYGDAPVDEWDEVSATWGEVVQRLREQVASMQQLINRNRELRERTEQVAVIEERQRLARELHDSVSQQMFAVSLHAASASRRLQRTLEQGGALVDAVSLKPLLERLAALEELSTQAQREMRALILHLRPVELDGKTLREALHEFLADVEARIPLRYQFEVHHLEDLPAGIEDQLFRIVQEALSNALRHADAEHIRLYLAREADTLVFQLDDNGHGFDTRERSSISYGLKTMKERTEQLGGRLTITSAPGHGTRIVAQIPVISVEEGTP